ncbi:MAG: hypothetical protein PHT94_01030 [Candidatus Nanoarchaeia archaeon]|nr:hypothetical protein [Candidatus Nanoarchaeia archaeon]
MGHFLNKLADIYCYFFDHKVHTLFHTVIYDGKFPKHIFETIKKNAYWSPEEIIEGCLQIEKDEFINSNNSKVKVICKECIRCGKIFVEAEILDDNELKLQEPIS